MSFRSLLLGVLAGALLAGCATGSGSRDKALTEVLRSYGATVRWGDLAQATAFIDPELRDAQAPTQLDLQRMEQLRVAYYRDDSGPVLLDASRAQQVVEIGLINVHTRVQRSVIDRQEWRYDEQARRWWLVSGLPDLTAR